MVYIEWVKYLMEMEVLKPQYSIAFHFLSCKKYIKILAITFQMSKCLIHFCPEMYLYVEEENSTSVELLLFFLFFLLQA